MVLSQQVMVFLGVYFFPQVHKFVNVSSGFWGSWSSPTDDFTLHCFTETGKHG